MTKKQNPEIESGRITARLYSLMEEAVETGVTFGYRRAFKHTDSPNELDVIEHIVQEVMNAICERFTFPEELT